MKATPKGEFSLFTLLAKFALLLLLLLMLGNLTFAKVDYYAKGTEIEVVVTPDRIPETATLTSVHTEIISSEELSLEEFKPLSEALENISSNLTVNNYGGPGKLSSLITASSLSSKDTLVLIDGFQVKSPTTGNFDFGMLFLFAPTKVELSNTSVSSSYGSDAMGGVINIIEVIPKNATTTSNLKLFGGKDSTFSFYLSTARNSKSTSWYLGFGHYKTDGFSAYYNGTEEDGVEKNYATLKVVNHDGAYTYKATFKYWDDDIDLDFGTSDGFSLNNDDNNYTEDRKAFLAGISIEKDVSDKTSYTLKLHKYYENTETKDPDDTYKYYSSDVTGILEDASFLAKHVIDEKQILLGGFDFKHEYGHYLSSSTYEKDVDTFGVWLGYKWKLSEKKNALSVVDVTIRTDKNEAFDSETTFKVGFARKVSDMTFKMNYSKGFKAPSLNDLYWPDTGWSSGNPNLDPETNREINVSISKKFEKTELELTFYRNKYDDLITWQNTGTKWQPVNVDEATSKGWSAKINHKLTNHVDVSASYTYINAKNDNTDNYIPYKPKHKLTANVSYKEKKVKAELSVRSIGERYTDTNNTEKLDSYTVADLNVSYKVSEKVEIFVRVNNISDKDYQPVKNYAGTPREAFVGVKIKW